MTSALFERLGGSIAQKARVPLNMKELLKSGLVVKRGRGYRPMGAKATQLFAHRLGEELTEEEIALQHGAHMRNKWVLMRG